jgi:membrane associated rhomboid family serine protease
MFPYSDNLIRHGHYVCVEALIAVLFAINTCIFISSDLRSWAYQYLSFIPEHLSLSAWSGYSLFTSVFLHADVFHLCGNCLFLWVFGRSLERLFGPGLFVLIFMFLGALGALLHWVLNADSLNPVIGASGAISTLMGGYLVLFPNAKMKMIFIAGYVFKRFKLPAWTFLFYFAGLQLLSLAFGAGNEDHVAYGVHIGGFMIGVMAAMIWKVSSPDAERNLTKFTGEAFTSSSGR